MHAALPMRQQAQATPHQAMWASGDFSMIAANTAIVGELLCEAAGLKANQRVLDIATGSGNTAIAAARRWCEVSGLDFVPALLERARTRVAAERLSAEFYEGDAEKLPFPDASFDVVLSTFGVMFASQPRKASLEMLRVCRAGGTIGLTSWTPDSFMARLQQVSARYAPSPPNGRREPVAELSGDGTAGTDVSMSAAVLWGTEPALCELLGDAVSSITATRQTFVMRAPSVEHWLDFTGRYLGPVQQLLAHLDSTRREAVRTEVAAIAHAFNRSDDSTMLISAEYLQVIAVRR